MPTATNTLGRAGEIHKIDPNAIQEEPGYNIRRDYGDIPGFAASLVENGVLTLAPIVVQRAPDGGFVVRAGHRRLRAVRYANEELGAEIKYIPACIRSKNIGQSEALLETILENDGKALEAAELTEGYNRLLKWGWSQVDIARRVGKSQSHVSRVIGLTDATDDVKDALLNKEITHQEALNIVKASSEPASAAPGETVILPEIPVPNGEHVKTLPLPSASTMSPAEIQKQTLAKIKGTPKPARAKKPGQKRFLQLLLNELEANFGSLEEYREKRGNAPYSGAEMTAYLSGRLSMLCELCGADKDIADLAQLIALAKGE